MVYLTRKEHFNAAHKLYNPKWSVEKNQEVFGKCANENWHGHNYYLHITVKGKPCPDTGFVMDAKELSKLIKQEIVEKLDHKNLNLDVPFLENNLPTTENLAMAIWRVLEPKLTTAKLHCVRIFETENIYVDYFGEE